MNPTELVLRGMALYIDIHGLHTGAQFAVNGPLGPRLDICAVAYKQAEGPVPMEFFTDEDASIRLIKASAPTMLAIQAISNTLHSDPPTTEIAPGHEVPDYIEHVSNWAATRPIGGIAPPTTTQVIGRILRAAHNLDATSPADV